MNQNSLKTYKELIHIDSFLDRIKYLMLFGSVNEETFGVNRYLNQNLYKSTRWKTIRRDIILRDDGFDLGHKDRPINGYIYVHHITPITVDDILNDNPMVYDPDNLISCSHAVHNAIHYSTLNDIKIQFAEYQPRKENDTCPWRC